VLSDKNAGSEGKQRRNKERQRFIDISREVKTSSDVTADPRTQEE
jgi:hypothetical protein